MHIGRLTAFEPEERDDTAETNIVLEDIRNAHTGVHELLSTLVGNSRDERSRLADEAQLLRPLVVHGDDRRIALGFRNDGAIRHERVVRLLKDSGQVLEGVGNNESGGFHRGILRIGSLHIRVGHRTRVAELHLCGEHLCASTDGPSNDRFLDLPRLDGLNDTVLFNTTDFTKQDEHLALGVRLVAKEMVNKSRARVAITTDGNTLIGAVGDDRKDVVELVGHASRFGDVADRAGAVELRRNDVVHHPTRVTDPEAARLDTADGGRTDDKDTFLLGEMEDLPGMSFGHTLGDESKALDLREPEDIQCRGIDRARGRKVDYAVDLRMLFHSFLDRGIDGKESLFGAPVELLDVVATEGIDHRRDGGVLTTATVVEVEHALDSTRLETIHERASVGIKWSVGGASRGVHIEVDDLVVGLDAYTLGTEDANGLLRLLDGGIDGGRSAGSRGGHAVSFCARSALRLCDTQSEWDNLGDVGLGAVHLDRNTKRLAKETHGLETLLVVRATTADENADRMVDKRSLVLFESTDDAFESRGDVCEVGNTTTNDENLSFRVWSATGHQIDCRKMSEKYIVSGECIQDVLIVFAYS